MWYKVFITYHNHISSSLQTLIDFFRIFPPLSLGTLVIHPFMGCHVKLAHTVTLLAVGTTTHGTVCEYAAPPILHNHSLCLVMQVVRAANYNNVTEFTARLFHPHHHKQHQHRPVPRLPASVASPRLATGSGVNWLADLTRGSNSGMLFCVVFLWVWVRMQSQGSVNNMFGWVCVVLGICLLGWDFSLIVFMNLYV